MADASRTFKVNIVSTYDATGNNTAAQGLQEVGKATAKAGENAEEFNVHGREMRRLFGELDRVSPGLGEAIKGIFEPSHLGIIAVLVTVEAMVKQFEKWKKVQEEAAEVGQAIWEAQFEGARKAAESAKEYEEIINRMPSVLEIINGKFEHRKTILQEEVKAQKEILELREKEELAAAGGDKNKEDEIRRRYSAAGRGADVAGEERALLEQRNELSELIAAERAARLRSDAAEETNKAAQTEPEDVVAAQRFIDKNKAEAAKARKYIDDNGGVESAGQEIQRQRDTHNGQNTVFGQQLQDMLDLMSKFQGSEEKVAEWGEKTKHAAQSASDTLKEFEALKTKVAALTQQVETSQSVLDIHHDTARQQKNADLIIGAGGTDAALQGGLGALETLYSGKALNQKGQQQYAAMGAVFDQIGGHFDRALQLMFTMHQRNASNEQRLAALEALVRTQSSAHARVSPTGQ